MICCSICALSDCQLTDKDLMTEIVPKGSVACDGVSLTITSVSRVSFEINIIPFTWGHTILSDLKSGDSVNIETDMLGKYVRQYMESTQPVSRIDLDMLEKAGF